MNDVSSTLTGKTIMVTRPRAQGDRFTELLRNRGARVIEFPTIEIIPPDNWDAADEAIRSLSMYHVVVWTSANAVRMVCSRMVHLGFSIHAFDACRMSAVGRATQAALEEYGLAAQTFDGVRNAEDLARHLDFENKSVLFPRGDKAMEKLPAIMREKGNTVTEIVVYRTQKAAAGDTASIRRHMQEGNIDAVTFFSPSSFENFIDLEWAVHRTVLAAIGPTTAQRIRDAGYPCSIVSEKPDVESMILAMENHFEHVTIA